MAGGYRERLMPEKPSRKPLQPGEYTITPADVELDKNGQLRLRPEANPIPRPPPRPSCKRCGAYMARGTDAHPECPFCDGGVEG